MSRVERSPIKIPAGVEVVLKGQHINVKGKNGALELDIDKAVKVVIEKDNDVSFIKFMPEKSINSAVTLAGTMRAIIRNMVHGVSEGYQIKLVLEGVGYRAQVQGKNLNLSLGFSHPVQYVLPEFVTAETPSQTEIILKSINKQLLGQVAAEIRSYRPPEPYKGKGVRYFGEVIILKEGKKK